MTLLENGLLEADWGDEKSHKVRVFPSNVVREAGNIFSPPGWMVFHREDGPYVQPEARDARSKDPDRMKDGTKGFLIFNFGKRGDTGLMQTVEGVPRGSTVKLSAWAHAWSNHKDDKKPDAFPHPDEPKWSEGAGYRKIAWPAGSQPSDTGDPQQDGKANFTFRIGIDPTGGNDPYSDMVEWSRAFHIYNAYVEQLTVEAVAQSETVTVFLHSETLWAYKHNDAYWDGAVLEIVEAPDPDDDVVPPGSDAREPFWRTAVVIDPDLDPYDVVSGFSYVWNLFRFTITQPDDAGLGRGLKQKDALVLNPHKYADPIDEFFDVYYPDANYIPIPWSNDRQLQGRLLAYGLMRDGLKLAYPTTHEPPFVTGEFGEPRDYGLHEGLDLRSSYNRWKDKILCALPGKVVVAGENGTEPWYGHQVRIETQFNQFTLLTRYAHFVPGSVNVHIGQQVNVNDILGKPGSSGNASGDHLHIDVRVKHPSIPDNVIRYADPAVLLGISLEEPDSPPVPPIPPTSNLSIYPETGVAGHVGMQILGSADYIPQFNAELPPPVHKVVLVHNEIGLAPEHSIKIYRQWVADQNYYRFHPRPDEAAEQWCNLFMPDLLYHCRKFGIKKVYVESLNETYDYDYGLNIQSRDIDIAVIHRVAAWDRENPDVDIRTIFFCAAVGNGPMLGDPGGLDHWNMLLELFKIAEDHEAAAGYHAYWIANLQHPEWYEALGPYLQYRWEGYRKWLAGKGVDSLWVFTEGGPCGGSWDGINNPSLNPGSGWATAYGRHDAGWARAVDEFKKFDQYCAKINRVHGGVIGGLATFQVGANDPTWHPFAPREYLPSLGTAIKALY